MGFPLPPPPTKIVVTKFGLLRYFAPHPLNKFGLPKIFIFYRASLGMCYRAS